MHIVALHEQPVSVWWHIGFVRDRRAGGAPDRQAGRIRPRVLFPIQPLDTAGSWNNDLGPISLVYGPAVSYPVILAFFFSLLQAQLDVHRL